MAQHVDFFELRLDELLAAEARIDRHDEDHVEVLQELFDHREARAGIQCDAGLAAGSLDLLHDAVAVLGCLDVERDDVRAGLSEGLDLRLGMLDHQVDIEDALRCLAQALDDR